MYPQQSMSRMQPCAAAEQHRVDEVSRAHIADPQHIVMPMVQTVPSVVHAELRHVPLWQVLPMQQSESAMQVLPADAHWQVPLRQVSAPQQSAVLVHDCDAVRHAHMPPVHDAPPQQSLPDPQAPPAALQHVPEVPPVGLVQVSVPQHRGPPVMQAAPAATHMVPIIWHWPLWQVSPVVQSMSEVHMPPVMLRAQRPERQVRPPQHSLSAAHAPASARQQRVLPWASAQEVPLAHAGMPPGVQSAPGPSGVMPSEHRPATHARPMQQLSVVAQVAPAALQRLQIPPMHDSDGFVQVFMSQQRCIMFPHGGVGDIPQRIVMVLHVSPDSHAERPQQGSSIPPHDIIPAIVAHMPLMHMSPALHALDPQHV